MKLYQIIVLFVIILTSLSIGTAYAVSLDETNEECEKWLEIIELAIQGDHLYLIEDALKIAEMKCGYDVDDSTS